MNDHQDDTATSAPGPPVPPRLPDRELHVDFGEPRPGSTNPMPAARRTEYETRIRNSVEAQAAGAEKASQLFIR